ncbi:baseplate protein [Escherichia coli]|uniref:baseplate protein n=1 Tax=Escherichia coli TaxID=562 RepID=UPI001833B630|nr:baseplate protein [Escherichia coli]EFH8163161.1 baseplate protein [Escherichia coli]EKG7113537.1 baseplate protein [Escherichia coli]EKI3096607.1 baseplate protein [Escherichia coli]EKR4921309.1 baseplate protein [Escherichia coli]ELM8776642.1 baseplate protein [Escherichia coli]
MSSPGHFNSRGNVGYLKEKYDRNRMAGEKLIGAEFELTIRGYANLSILVRTTQYPEMARQDVEDTGPMGLLFNQHGVLKNSGEIQVQCVETITGEVAAMVIEIVKTKKYVDMTIKSTPESLSGSGAASLIRELSDCKIYCDQVDLATEDNTALVRPGLRIVYNWVQ